MRLHRGLSALTTVGQRSGAVSWGGGGGVVGFNSSRTAGGCGFMGGWSASTTVGQRSDAVSWGVVGFNNGWTAVG